MPNIAENFQKIAKTVPETVALVCVTKYVDILKTREVISAGGDIIGENRVQVAQAKQAELPQTVSWHMIGPLQKNKARQAVRLFDLIHSVDSLALAIVLDKEAKKVEKVQNILVQVNIGLEEQKSGVAPDMVEEIILKINELPNLLVKGLMSIPPFSQDPEQTRPYFRKMKSILEQLNQLEGVDLEILSMGMSGDYLVAIEEGATMVRVGSLLFK